MTRVITFLSASKGVGKTLISVSLAYGLEQMGYRTCLFNTDVSADTIHGLLGVRPQRTLEDLVNHRCSLKDILIVRAGNVHYFPGSPGIETVGNLRAEDRQRLIRSFSVLDRFDYLLLDTISGVSRNVAAFCSSTDEIILVMTPDAVSFSDSYTLLKTLVANGFKGYIMVIINKSPGVKVARRCYGKFKEAIHADLPITLVPLGTVFHHKDTATASRMKGPFVLRDPESDPARCIVNIARNLSERKAKGLLVSDFFIRFFNQMKRPYRLAGIPFTGDSKTDGSAYHIKRDQAVALNNGVSAGSSLPLSSIDEIRRNHKDLQKMCSNMLQHLELISRQLAEVIELLSIREETRAEMSKTYGRGAHGRSDKIPLDFEAFFRQKEGNG
ncbi:MAG: P-loop NTPase [Deltaproteobacteria bacterium]|nr:P-loop NTPase [Deltaproteobacteria bacterium]MBW2151874.1 P-loop NTPase [Deltaproteobacteria bacterium]